LILPSPSPSFMAVSGRPCIGSVEVGPVNAAEPMCSVYPHAGFVTRKRGRKWGRVTCSESLSLPAQRWRLGCWHRHSERSRRRAGPPPQPSSRQPTRCRQLRRPKRSSCRHRRPSRQCRARVRVTAGSTLATTTPVAPTTVPVRLMLPPGARITDGLMRAGGRRITRGPQCIFPRRRSVRATA
jgi:hypothetical protein